MEFSKTLEGYSAMTDKEVALNIGKGKMHKVICGGTPEDCLKNNGEICATDKIECRKIKMEINLTAETTKVRPSNWKGKK